MRATQGAGASSSRQATGDGELRRGHERSNSVGATPSSGHRQLYAEHWNSPDSSFSSAGASPMAERHAPLPSPRQRGRLPCLRIFIEKVALDNARELEQAYFSISLRGANGSVQVR